MYLPVILRFRIVAGRKVYIPLRVEKSKELVYAIRLILKSLIKRNETQFHKRLIAELFDVYNNRGLSIKRRLELCNEITVNIPNFRFLKYRKKH